jgi:hypothetical protein
MFRPTMQEAVHTVLLVAQRLDANISLDRHGDEKHQMLRLPHDLWCYILRFGRHACA